MFNRSVSTLVLIVCLGSAPASALDIGVGGVGVSADVGGGGVSVGADVGGAGGASVGASVGTGGASVGVDAGGASADVGVDAGGASVGVDAGGAGAGVSVDRGGTSVSVGAGGASAGGASVGVSAGAGGAAADVDSSAGSGATTGGASAPAGGVNSTNSVDRPSSGTVRSRPSATDAAPEETAKVRPFWQFMGTYRAISLPPVLRPARGDKGSGGALGYPARPFVALKVKPGVTSVVLRTCRSAIASAARPLGAVRVEAVSAGRQLRSGKLVVAPLDVRIRYERRGGVEVRQAKVSCRLDSAGRVVAVR